MTVELIMILREILEGSGEIEQIHYLKGGNISLDTLTTVVEYPATWKNRMRVQTVYAPNGDVIMSRKTLVKAEL